MTTIRFRILKQSNGVIRIIPLPDETEIQMNAIDPNVSLICDIDETALKHQLYYEPTKSPHKGVSNRNTQTTP